MQVVAFATKVMLAYDDGKIVLDSFIDGIQLDAAAEIVKPILARLDRENPGLMPLPYDNIPLSERWK